MASSSVTTGRPSSSHRSERLPPHHGSNNNGLGRNGVVNLSASSQPIQQNSRSKNASANSRRSVTPTSRTRSPPQENDPGFDFSCLIVGCIVFVIFEFCCFHLGFLCCCCFLGKN